MRFLLTILLLFLSAAVLFGGGFGVNAGLSEGGSVLVLTLQAPEGGYFDAGFIAVSGPEGTRIEPDNHPAPQPDDMYEAGIFPAGTVLRYRIDPPAAALTGFSVEFMGCEKNICHPPSVVKLDGAASGVAPAPEAQSMKVTGDSWRSIAGYHDADEFIRWMDNGEEDGANVLDQVVSRWGLLAAALLLLPLGALLNLTPCILPMIPVNLGVIGARAAGGGRRHGFLLGGIYGISMALSYGLAGIIFVVIGGRFGSWNASPWFNYAIALIFAVLALAMFDKLFIDFTRFRKFSVAGRYSPGITAALLGVMSALLAGACVAPVLIWVLLLSARLYSEGSAAALWLPLLLGAGMGLPWPLLGAGAAMLPKPGPWMNRVKYLFGIIIMLAAIHYLWTGISLHRAVPAGELPAVSGWHTSPEAAFREAETTGKALFIDFWGISCKACKTMEATTLRDPRVTERLDSMVRLKLQADDFNNPEIAPYIKKYQVIGLPTYVIE
ncbi:MAG: thioredoxin family protein [Victivallales bacterium]|nr:thioredoxin family protein [Victivallales bacterium]